MSRSFFLADESRQTLSGVAGEIVESLFRRSAAAARHERVEAALPTSNAVFLERYAELCRLLEGAVEQESRVILWFLAGEDDLNPLPLGATYSRLCSMLALTFPEVAFVRIESLSDVLSAMLLWQAGFSPLFDGAGLRSKIRETMICYNGGASDVSYLPVRKQLALAIDDEESYAYLHAYISLRFGFRAVPVGTKALADLLLKKDERNRTSHAPLDAPVSLTLEDLFLRFADGDTQHYSNDDTRKSEWQRLADDNPVRVFVTSGGAQESGCGIGTRQTPPLYKPHAGMFQLWRDSGLQHRCFGEVQNQRYVGVGKGYSLLPPDASSCQKNASSHSADGTLTLIAQRLIDRAEKLLGRGHLTVSDAVRGAVFATEALELLGGRTPTASIEGLRLKHELEVTAECQFSGVEYHPAIGLRLEEIRGFVNAIGRRFHPKKASDAAINAEMTICSRLALLFRENAKFDEEQICNAQVRSLHNKLWRRQRRFGCLAAPFHWYIEHLLTSMPRFLLWIGGWILLLAVLYCVSLQGSFGRGLESAVTSFFSVGAPIEHGGASITSVFHAATVCLAVVAGFLHLGVFISHLYTIVSRR
jgi:hypothetical protein